MVVLWAVVAVASGCIGLALRRWQANRGLPVRRSGRALVSLWAMVAGHFLYWLITTGLR